MGYLFAATIFLIIAVVVGFLVTVVSIARRNKMKDLNKSKSHFKVTFVFLCIYKYDSLSSHPFVKKELVLSSLCRFIGDSKRGVY
ncbi:hypothetical protein ACR3I8_03485 [Priestia flexa]